MWIDDEGGEDYSYTSCAGRGQQYRMSESDAAMGVISCSAACERPLRKKNVMQTRWLGRS